MDSIKGSVKCTRLLEAKLERDSDIGKALLCHLLQLIAGQLALEVQVVRKALNADRCFVVRAQHLLHLQKQNKTVSIST